MALNFLKTSFQKLQRALTKTRSYLASKLGQFFSAPVDIERLHELEEILYEADLGVELAGELTETLRRRLQKDPKVTAQQLLEEIKEELLRLFPKAPLSEGEKETLPKPFVILVVGVNGNGKTTTCAKLAKYYQTLGCTPILGAADTFRAAAVEQLSFLAERIGADLVKGQPKSDPAAVAYDTLQAAIGRGKDVALIDTAGRLHTKTPLMQELQKIRRVCEKATPGAPHETYLVLDATIGQNAIDQAKVFKEFTPITGLILTKLDGSAKGGIILAIQRQLGIPVKFVGVGEGVEDLEPFNPETFVHSLFESPSDPS